MERALVKRLYKDESSHEPVMLMETTETRERIKVTIPWQRAGILALEGHGLNDRCSLYRLLAECIGQLGGSLRSVVVDLDGSRGVSGAISLARGAHVTWVKADVVELVALALHVQVPIYLNVKGPPGSDEGRTGASSTRLPPVFEDALSEIMCSALDGEQASKKEEAQSEAGSEQGSDSDAA